MKVAVFNTKAYDQSFFNSSNEKYGHNLQFFEFALNPQSATLASDFPVVCVFVNDLINRKTIEILAQGKTRLIALRCAGFNNVNLKAAQEFGIGVVRVPAYSPYAVAEHTIALMLTLNRQIHRAYNRVREGNFSLNGLLGFDLHGCTVGIIGTGKIGRIVGQILTGFGCKILAYDLYPDQEFAQKYAQYVSLDELFAQANIISLHCPLTPETYHLINQEAITKMKSGVMLINTSRGGLIDTETIIDGLKSQKIAYLALDVYEQEENLFFEDLSNEVIQDDTFQRLLTFPNVIITGHQAFFTKNALENIADTTLANITDFEQGKSCPNEIKHF
ncbi:D-lactate dehydrogenase [Stanieria cyanosphaera PCC 7437]|uniref:D-lactate dehydrogenase n=1 Tax=Stanieria cyanosphaera (strain ATCC 29371 / PCC 7437) TaxID=111780 RepID=K9XSW8_STAC7|nr:2-hydroxyacid dehydrogenase [Stanieria cyanosphaera]AFZ35623.1 D-lactate dehydrogenase [Stanieria cyanosphaera PCC 7437]